MPKKLTQKEVTQRFHDRWGDRYCYSKVKYVNRRTKVETLPLLMFYKILMIHIIGYVLNVVIPIKQWSKIEYE